MKNYRATLLRPLLALAFAGGLAACDGQRPWESVLAIYYPNAPDLTVFEQMEVSSVEDCRVWAAFRAEAQNDTQWDYECGIGCEPSTLDMQICRVTER